MKEKIHNLFNKRGFKIAVKVLTICSYIFSIFMLIILVIGLCLYNADDAKVLAYDNASKAHEPKINKVVQVDISSSERYRFYSINDLTSYDVMTNMYNYDRNHGNFFEGTSSHSFTFTPNSPSDIYIVDGGDTAHYNEGGFELKYRIKGCAFTWSESANRIVMGSDFTICGLNNTTTLGHFHVNNVRYKFSGILSQSTCSYFYSTSDVGLTLLLQSSFYIRGLQTSQDYNIYDFFGYGNLPDTTSAYDVGYQSGYSAGHNDGYNEGYSSGSTGMTTNPFNLIRNAFQAVASILNIQVLPNLTLGVLIFTPLIVTIIIVVVKMIRG